MNYALLIYLSIHPFIHSVVCRKTSPHPLRRWVLHPVSFQYPLLSLSLFSTSVLSSRHFYPSFCLSFNKVLQKTSYARCNQYNYFIFYLLLLTAIGVIPGGSGTTVQHNTKNNTQHTTQQKQSSACATHKNTKWVFKPNKELKVNDSALITIWHNFKNWCTHVSSRPSLHHTYKHFTTPPFKHPSPHFTSLHFMMVFTTLLLS